MEQFTEEEVVRLKRLAAVTEEDVKAWVQTLFDMPETQEKYTKLLQPVFDEMEKHVVAALEEGNSDEALSQMIAAQVLPIFDALKARVTKLEAALFRYVGRTG